MQGESIAQAMCSIAVEAGLSAQQAATKELRLSTKSDTTLVSNVDAEVEALLRERLHSLLPEAGFIGEESAENVSFAERREHARELLAHEKCWCVDPIDGTVNFIRGWGDWAVSIALLRRGDQGQEPALGAIYLPLMDTVFYTDGESSFVVHNASRSGISNRQRLEPFEDETNRLRILCVSKSMLMKHDFGSLIDLRFSGCTVEHLASVLVGASVGSAQRAHLWDVAAGHAIGRPLGIRYYSIPKAQEQTGFELEDFHFGDAQLDWRFTDYNIICWRHAAASLLEEIQSLD